MKKPTVLVVGGAGYIGSHVNKLLGMRGYPTVVLDSLATGTRAAVVHGDLVHGNMGDRALVARLFRERAIGAVLHLAAYIKVGESVRQPSKYYQNNVCNTLALLETMKAANVNVLLFSSTAAVYGEPQTRRIEESHPKLPINPYGRSKWMVEQILADLAAAQALRYCALRYFNAAGADPEGQLKTSAGTPQNLIPIALRSLLDESQLTLFGDDYPTSDGSCVRDYIHVWDLAEAHLLALEQLLDGGPSKQYNLGLGRGHSVKEVCDAVESVTGRRLKTTVGARRPGDPPTLVAYAEKARLELGWQPRYPELSQIIQDAWRAMQ